MNRRQTDYTLKEDGNIVFIFKNDKPCGCGVIGISSALESIFVMESMTKKDWLIYEDEKVWLVDRLENKIPEHREEPIR